MDWFVLLWVTEDVRLRGVITPGVVAQTTGLWSEMLHVLITES